MNLWRFHGFRRLLAIAAMPLVVVLAALVTATGPPASYGSWTVSGQQALSALVWGSYEMAVAMWLGWFVGQYVWIPFLRLRALAGCLGWLLVGLPAGCALRQLALAGWKLVDVPLAVVPELAITYLRLVLVPLALICLPLWAVEFYEWWRAIRLLRRWRTQGQGSHAEWIRASELRRLTGRLPGEGRWW